MGILFQSALHVIILSRMICVYKWLTLLHLLNDIQLFTYFCIWCFNLLFAFFCVFYFQGYLLYIYMLFQLVIYVVLFTSMYYIAVGDIYLLLCRVFLVYCTWN